MAVNLIRNSRVFFTTNVNTKGQVRLGAYKATSGSNNFTSSNTWEIQVLEGMSFSQNTTVDTVTLNEAGATPARGQRSFNTALEPVDFSFSTYLRPYKSAAGTALTPTTVTAEEKVLWNAFAGAGALGDTTGRIGVQKVVVSTAGATGTFTAATTTVTFSSPASGGSAATGTAIIDSAGIVTGVTITSPGSYLPTDTVTCTIADSDAGVETTGTVTVDQLGSTTLGGGWNEGWDNGTVSTPAKVLLENSNKHQLQAFGLIIVFDDLTYVIDNCALDSATIDFGIDAIASIQWAGKGSAIRQVTLAASTANPVVLSGADIDSSTAQQATAKNTAAKYITNKLSTLQVNNTINDFTDSDYVVPITGGNITLSNNLTYLTPANLGTVNLPITYFTGTRSITGTLTAYLRSGTANTAGLLDSLLTGAATEINPDFAINIQLGGGSNSTRVDFKIPAAMVQIPTVNTEQVISTTITFTGQGWSGATGTNKFSIDEANEISINYYATAA